MDMPEIEVVDTESETVEVDVPGQIMAVESEIGALEAQYNEANGPRIEALKRKLGELRNRI